MARNFDNYLSIIIADLPIWNFDGSSTGQALGENSDVYLKPVAIYKDPFRGGKNKLVLCETLDHTMVPTSRSKCLGC